MNANTKPVVGIVMGSDSDWPVMREAAEALRLTAQDQQKLGVIDQIIPEPMGGAQRAPVDAIASVGQAITAMLADLDGKAPQELIRERREKFLNMGAKTLAG